MELNNQNEDNINNKIKTNNLENLLKANSVRKFSRLLVLILIFMMSLFWLFSSIMIGYIWKNSQDCGCRDWLGFSKWRHQLHSTQYAKGNICDQKQNKTDWAGTVYEFTQQIIQTVRIKMTLHFALNIAQWCTCDFLKVDRVP